MRLLGIVIFGLATLFFISFAKADGLKYSFKDTKKAVYEVKIVGEMPKGNETYLGMIAYSALPADASNG